MAKMRLLALSAVSVALTSAVVAHGFYQKQQFYPTVVYLTKSSPSLAVRLALCILGMCSIIKRLVERSPSGLSTQTPHRTG